MKGHKIHPHHMHEKASHLFHARKDGGPVRGEDDAEEDLKDNPRKTDDVDDVEEEAEEKKVKRGGKVKKRVGGPVGAAARKHGGRAARKSGGGCEADPFSSARAGTAAKGRKLEKETMD